MRELSKIFDAETKIPNRDALPTPPNPLTQKRTKLPRVKDQTSPPPKFDPYEEYKNRDQKLPSSIQKTPPSEATRKKYTKKKRN